MNNILVLNPLQLDLVAFFRGLSLVLLYFGCNLKKSVVWWASTDRKRFLSYLFGYLHNLCGHPYFPSFFIWCCGNCGMTFSCASLVNSWVIVTFLRVGRWNKELSISEFLFWGLQLSESLTTNSSSLSRSWEI